MSNAVNKSQTQVSALRVNGNASRLVKAGSSHKSANDSVSQWPATNRRGYVTPARVRAVSNQLTDRQLEIIDILEHVHLATGRQLQTLLWGEGRSAARQARRELQVLTDLRVLTRLERRPYGVRGGTLGFVYALDMVGQAIVGVPARRRKPRLPGMAFAAHAVAVTDCFVTLRKLEAASRIELIEFASEPGCWRGFAGPGGYQRVLKPDAFVITATPEWEDRWLLEVDRGTESPSRLRTKLATHIAYYQSGREQADTDVFPKILWIVPDDARRTVLINLLASLPPEHWKLFAVCTDDQLEDVILAGAGELADESEVSP
jgi:hypothetical protein